jgi:hypothetical protein
MRKYKLLLLHAEKFRVPASICQDPHDMRAEDIAGLTPQQIASNSNLH